MNTNKGGYNHDNNFSINTDIRGIIYWFNGGGYALARSDNWYRTNSRVIQVSEENIRKEERLGM